MTDKRELSREDVEDHIQGVIDNTAGECPPNEDGDVTKLLDHDAAQREIVKAARAYVEARIAPCTHGHPPAAWADGCVCYDCAESWIEPWEALMKALGVKSDD